jgi:hypothetical protein
MLLREIMRDLREAEKNAHNPTPFPLLYTQRIPGKFYLWLHFSNSIRPTLEETSPV